MDQIMPNNCKTEKKNPAGDPGRSYPLAGQIFELTAYVVVGVLTTGVYFLTYAVLKYFGVSYMINTCLSWIAAVLFAFFANKYFVFRSMRASVLLQEMIRFFGARVLTLLMDLFITWACIELLVIGEWKTKLFSQIVVMVLNYLLSKLFVFRRGQIKSGHLQK